MRRPTRRTHRTWARSRVSRCTRDRYACGLGIPPTKKAAQPCGLKSGNALSSIRICAAAGMRNREVRIFFSSDFVVCDARGLLFVVGDVNLEIRKERTTFALQQAQTPDRHATDLELRAFAAAQLEHRAPGARVAGDDDLHLGR